MLSGVPRGENREIAVASAAFRVRLTKEEEPWQLHKLMLQKFHQIYLLKEHRTLQQNSRSTENRMCKVGNQYLYFHADDISVNRTFAISTDI